jgi:hypothetical protein
MTRATLLAHSSNGHLSVDGGLKGREGVTQAGLHLAHRGVERIDGGQMQAQEELVMRRDPACKAALTAGRDVLSHP